MLTLGNATADVSSVSNVSSVSMLTLEEGLRRDTPPMDSEEEEESEAHVQGGITSAGEPPSPFFSVSFLYERVVCERNRDPSRTTTPAGGLSL